MNRSKNGFSRQLFLRGAAVTVLLGISPLGLSLNSRIIAIRIWHASSYTRVTLESNIALKYRQFILTDPDRVVLDLENIKLNKILQGIEKHISSYEPYLRFIRVRQFKQKVVRLVFEVKTRVNPQIFTIVPINGFKYRLIIDFHPYYAINIDNNNVLLDLLKNCNESKLHNLLPIKVKKNSKEDRNKPIVIMIDPGHGGEDPGAIGKCKTQEKDIVLQIAQRLRILINHEPKMKVYMTRNKDVFIPLKVRVAKARKIHADLFVSIHTNSFTNRKARGSSVFALSNKEVIDNISNYLTKVHKEIDFPNEINKSNYKCFNHTICNLIQISTINDSLKFGTEVLKRIGNVNNLHKKNVDQASFSVLKTPEIPSILIETAFISNLEEEQKLKTAKFQQQLAESIFRGIKSYFNKNNKLFLHQ